VKKLFLLLSIFSLLTWSGTAFAISFTMTNFGSDDVSSILASVESISGGATVSVDVSAGPIVGDITGVFFDLEAPFVDIKQITVPGYDFTQDEGNVDKAPNNSNIGSGGFPKFDVGVSIGTLGLTDDIQSIAFNVLGDGLDEFDFTRLGVRLQSVGSGSSREGSAKYVGSPVPEPTTMLLFGAGLVGLAGFGRKKFKK